MLTRRRTTGTPSAASTKPGSLIGTFEATRSANALAIKFGTNNAPGAAVIFGETGCAAATTTTASSK